MTVPLPAYILLLWMAFIAYILARNFANGMVDWKVAAVIAVLIGLGCFIARLGLVDLPKPFEAYDREGALYVKRGKELFRVVGIRDEYSVEKRGRRASCREGRLRRAGENDIIPSVGKMAVNSYDW